VLARAGHGSNTYVEAPIVLTCARATVTIDPDAGGRVASCVLDGRELLVTGPGEAMAWGSYPMVPYAGRIGHGRFAFNGGDYQLDINLAPHAIHGTGFTSGWEHDADVLVHRFDERWPFAGTARQRFELDDAGLTCHLEVEADEPQPVTIGWHPWFRRPAELTFDATTMYERDGDHLPTGRTHSVTPRPWDDCFTGVRQPVALAWPDGPRIEITSDCDHWVIYDPDHAICVEPQSGPPDAVNLAPQVVVPGQPLRRWMRWSWAARADIE
jgi:aldose 1-epimerase